MFFNFGRILTRSRYFPRARFTRLFCSALPLASGTSHVSGGLFSPFAPSAACRPKRRTALGTVQNHRKSPARYFLGSVYLIGSLLSIFLARCLGGLFLFRARQLLCVQFVNTSFRKLYGKFIRLNISGDERSLFVKTSFRFFENFSKPNISILSATKA